MRTNSLISYMRIFLICLVVPVVAYPDIGDVDDDGTVDINDAQCIARFLTGQISAIHNLSNADVTQDDKVDMDDAFTIAKHLAGQSRIVTVGSRYGPSNVLQIGDTVRIEVFEKFAPFNITGGIVSIRSLSTGYESGDQSLTFERNGRSLYYHWDTAGLIPASDYEITIELAESSVLSSPTSKSFALQTSEEADTVVTLNKRSFQPRLLASFVDASAPTPGIPLVFQRVYPHDSAHYPYLGPMGRGWVHNYDICLEEFTDGRIVFHGPDGFNRFFTSNADGTYNSSPGDYGILTRDADGTFQLAEKNELVYRFHSNLRLDFIEDLNGNRITAVYDSSDRLVEIRHSCGQSFFLEYDESGRIVSLTDHVGRVTTYEYWPGDTTDFMLTKVLDPLGAATEYVYATGQSDNLNYRLLSIAFPDDTHIHYEYDSQAHLIRQTGTWGANPVTYSYDPNGLTHITDGVGGVTAVQVDDFGNPILITNSEGALTQMVYDDWGNLVSLVDPLGRQTLSAYDEFGNITRVTNALNESTQFRHEAGFFKPVSITNALDITTSFEYDPNGNLASVIYPDSSEEIYVYDSQGNMTSFLDGTGKLSTYSYNESGRITEFKNALGDITSFSYDPNLNVASVTNAENVAAVSFDRDLMGRIKKQTYPDGSFENYEYDPAGKVTSFTNRKGETVSLLYDNTGRLEWKNYSSEKELNFHYDLAGYFVGVEEFIGNTIASYTIYERDLSHRVHRVKVPGKITPETYDISYAYDAADNRIFMAYPDGYALKYQYDGANRLIQISDANDVVIVSYEYDAAGRRTRRTLGNETYTTYEYDNLDRLTLLTNHAPDSTVQSQFGYTYNAAGIRTSMTTLEGTHKYTYDDIYQLTAVEYPDSNRVEYSFDPVGNRISVSENGIVTNYTTNQLDQYTQVGSETLEYDLNGNLVRRVSNGQITTYQWDEDNRLIGVDKNEIHIDYHYDHQGRLIAKTIDGQKTRYIWDGLELIAEMDSSGNVIKRYIYGPNINEVIVVSADGSSHWCQQDGLGSAVGTSGSDGDLISTINYDVYGKVRSGDLAPVSQRLAGMWWDADAGLYYVRARWYDCDLGRFVSTDPVGLVGGVNLYTYAINNPVLKLDPFGFLSWSWSGAWGGLVSGGFEGGVMGWAGGFGFSGPSAGGWSGWGSAIGSAIGGTVGAIYGSFGGPAGTVWGAAGGAAIGGAIGGGIGGFIGGGLSGGGGVCPTFIQYSVENTPKFVRHTESPEKQDLFAQIRVPWENCLLRADITIFGLACGKNFKSYWVEVGEGKNPSEWHLIESSTIPQQTCDIGLAEMKLMQGDIDIRGNLATWNTGLKNWAHLPWHPPEDNTDLNGIYTIRLVVEGKDGQIVEDRVTCEVGRVIAQCLPGVAISPDKRVIMHFSEQALTHPFRVYTILPLSYTGDETPKSPAGCSFIGPVYRMREPGDRFAKVVTLEISPTPAEIQDVNPEHIGICQYDVRNKKWEWQRTSRDERGTSYSTPLTELPTPRAIYALIFDPEIERSTPILDVLAKITAQPVHPGILIDCTFENDMGAFKERDRFVGATLTREKQPFPDRSYCLKLTNLNQSGNFSCTVFDKSFDVREYGTITFDYRISPGIKVDFYLKVNDRWYRLRFTGDEIDYRFRDVNIQDIGEIHGIIADNKWHTASVDLQYPLRRQTRHTRVDEIIMADWNVGGYMKLEFGSNPRGATYYIDNFKLTGQGTIDDNPDVLIVDNFDSSKATNALGGASGVYHTPGTNWFESMVVETPLRDVNMPRSSLSVANRELKLAFDMRLPNAYGGYWTALQGRDISEYNAIRFQLRTQSQLPPILIGIRNKTGIEGKVSISPYTTPANEDSLWNVRVPLSALRGLTDLSTPDVLFFAVSSKDQSGSATVWIDDVCFECAPVAKVADFEPSPTWNYLGGEYSIHQNGASALSFAFMPDTTMRPKADNTVCRISYGGSIGRDYGTQGGFSYCVWRCGLNGIDARGFKYLTLKIRGEKGGEIPNIYLNDSNKRIPIRAMEMPIVKQEWQKIQLPLVSYLRQGIDLSRLESVEIVFEWAEQSGTIYVDDIMFE